MNKSLVNTIKFLIFLGLGFGILYYVYHKQQLAYSAECALQGVPQSECSLVQKVITDFAGADFGWLAVVLLCFTISNVSRALRWNMLLKQLGSTPRFINAFLTINLGYFANLGLPRIGEVVRAGTMARYEKIGVEKVIGTVAVGRTIDVVTILLVTGLALLLGYDRIWGWIEQNNVLGDKLVNIQGILIGGTIVGLLVVFFVWRNRKRLAQKAIFAKIFGLIAGFAEGLKTILKLDRPWLFVFHSINIWVMYYLMTYLCLFAFAPTANLGLVAALI
ncbi:MAG: lysylphosphatidylglycerol synthase transmembrane domain-containing protein, partial [Bacteroidota bacterium]